MGLNLALGAFVAGLVVSESMYSHRVLADVLPFKDLFLTLFFVFVGLSVDLSVFVGMRKPPQNATNNVKCFCRLNGALGPHVFVEVWPIDELHADIGNGFILFDSINRSDVRMVQR